MKPAGPQSLAPNGNTVVNLLSESPQATPAKVTGRLNVSAGKSYLSREWRPRRPGFGMGVAVRCSLLRALRGVCFAPGQLQRQAVWLLARFVC